MLSGRTGSDDDTFASEKRSASARRAAHVRLPGHVPSALLPRRTAQKAEHDARPFAINQSYAREGDERALCLGFEVLEIVATGEIATG